MEYKSLANKGEALAFDAANFPQERYADWISSIELPSCFLILFPIDKPGPILQKGPVVEAWPSGLRRRS